LPPELPSFSKELTELMLKGTALTGKSNTLKQVSLMLGYAGNQPVALLMSQIYNIIVSSIQVLHLPKPNDETLWAEVVYQDSKLPVLELARLLNLPLVETLDRSRILVSGTARAGDKILQPFGIALDDILTIQTFRLSDIHTLPRWVAPALKGILMGMVLVEHELLLSEDESLLDSGILQPVNLISSIGNKAIASGKPELEGANVGRNNIATDTRRPVALINLANIKDIIYSGKLQ
jgi:chemotaxis signal transduction protein